MCGQVRPLINISCCGATRHTSLLTYQSVEWLVFHYSYTNAFPSLTAATLRWTGYHTSHLCPRNTSTKASCRQRSVFQSTAMRCATTQRGRQHDCIGRHCGGYECTYPHGRDPFVHCWRQGVIWCEHRHQWRAGAPPVDGPI